jgi:ADP-heptose:LPS heptosyltransferase
MSGGGSNPTSQRGSPRILIILLGLIGDTMMKIPFVRALREAYPEAHITGLCEPLSGPIFENDPNFDAVRVFDRRGMSYKEQAQYYLSLRSDGYDMTLDFYFGSRTAFMAWFTGARRRIGPANGRWARLFLTDPIPHPLPQVHMVDRHLPILAPLGITSFRRIWEMPVSQSMRERMLGQLTAAGIEQPPGRGDVAIAVGAGCETKRWDEEYLTEAMQRIAGGELGEGRRILVVADQREPEMTRRWSEIPGVVLLPPLSLLDLGALFSMVDLVFVPDTGLMHVALAQAPRMLTFFQSTDPDWHDAVRPAYHYLYNEICPYQPCDTEDKDKCQLECRRSLSVDSVLTAMRELLAAPAWDGVWPENRITDRMVSEQARLVESGGGA